MRASSAHATTLDATTSSWKTHVGAPVVIQTKTGIRTTALATRFHAGEMVPASRTLTLATSVSATSHLSEPARPALELRDRAVEIRRPEIRPEGRRDEELRVGDLPQEEVGDPHLAAGADQEIGIRDVGGVERFTDVLLGDVLGLELTRLHLAGQRPERVEQLVARAVVERHHHVETGVVAGLVHDVVDAAPN